jgi:asparagine synthase (glutamine-hydrolysing)
MGGIIGKLTFEPDVQISPDTVQRMIGAIGHRASPDVRSASFIEPGIALGSCDAEGGPQGDVACTAGGAIRAVADSELANAGSLRRSLARLGHVFRDDTDADVMAHAYAAWGDACIERFAGPFACAIWDARRRRLLLARDHLGIRPLCFALLHGDGVIFASEIKALLQDPSVGRECSPDAIDAYLALGYVPAPHTIYRRVSKLEAAHTLVVDGRRLTTRQYWDFYFDERPMRQADALERLRLSLRSTIAAQADRPDVGVLASSGVASAAIAAEFPRGRASITVGDADDATPLFRAAETARHLGLRAEIDLATPEPTDVARRLAWHLDEPVADLAAISQYALFVAARQHAAIALTGHGAAALWAGYARHRIEHVESGIRSMLPTPLAHVGGQIGRALGVSVKGARTLAHLTMPAAGACAVKQAYGLFDDDCRHDVYTRAFSWQVRESNPFARLEDVYRRCSAVDPLNRALYVEARTFLPDNHLAVADRVSAAAGLRLRHPFLARDLVNLAFGTPTGLKLRGATGMYALRRVASRRLPPGLRPAARREGPKRPWLPAALNVLVPHVLMTERFDSRGIFSRPALRRLWAEHCAGRRDHSRRFWAVLMLELWFREFIDGDAAAKPTEYAVVVRAA